MCPRRNKNADKMQNYSKRSNYNTSDNSGQSPKGQNVALVNDHSFGNSRFVVPAYLNGESIKCYRETGANLSVCRTCIIVPE